MSISVKTMVAVAGLAIITASAAADRKPVEVRGGEQLMNDLFECQAVPEDEKLRCYEANVAALKAAYAAHIFEVADKEDVNKTRRSLFGLELPNLRLFARQKQKDLTPELTNINAKIGSVSTQNGSLLLTLEDGARWLQVGDETLSYDPKPGDAIVIRRGAMGSFLANISERRAIRVRRIN